MLPINELKDNLSDLVPTALFSIAAVTSIVFTYTTGRRLLKRISYSDQQPSDSPSLNDTDSLEMKERK